jgi:hypothetical protein
MSYKDPKDRSRMMKRIYAERRSAWIKSQGGKCIKCGSDKFLQADHIDPSTKIHHSFWTWSEARRELELSKCQLLCRACHFDKSHREQWGRSPREHGHARMYEMFGCRCSKCKLAKQIKRKKSEPKFKNLYPHIKL